MIAKIAAANGGVRAGEADDGVFFLHVAADQFVGLADADDFLHAGHFFQGAGLDFALVAGDADGGALRARAWRARDTQVTLDLFANGAHLLFTWPAPS